MTRLLRFFRRRPSASPMDVQRARPDCRLSAETRCKTLCLAITPTKPFGRDYLERYGLWD